MSEAEQIKKEELRRGVRRVCAERPGLSLTVSAVRRALQHDIADITDAEVKSALIFMVDLKHLKSVKEKLGSSIYYQISAEGTLAHERNE